MLTLYTYFRSSAAFRVRIALNLKGLDYEPKVVWLPDDEHRTSAYREQNPQQLVPTLIDGELRISQSLAILEYLDEVHDGVSLLPADAAGRARVRSLAQLIACDVHPLNNLRVLKYLRTRLAQPEDAVLAWYRHWVEQGLAGFERQLALGGAGRYCHGDALSQADVCLIPQIFNAQRFKAPLDSYPLCMQIFESCMELDAFSKAQPAAQPEAARAG